MKIVKWFNTNNLTKLKIKKMIRALKIFQKIIRNKISWQSRVHSLGEF